MKIPESIQKILQNRPFSPNSVGLSGAQILCFDDMVLKTEPSSAGSDNECRMLRWLPGRLPVPRLIRFERENGLNHILMSRLEGEMLCAPEILADFGLLVRLLAQALRMIWDVDVSACPSDMRQEHTLDLARERVVKGLCSMDNCEPETYRDFESPAQLLRYLESSRPDEQPVFSHGDCCLPNIFAKDGRISGFLDLGRSGAADRYQDIALCYRSLKHNYDGSYGTAPSEVEPEALFYELGITPDWEKIRWYTLLDELF